MANPKVHEHNFGDWYWDERRIEVELKTPATVIKAKTIVNTDNSGKIEPWNLSSSASTGVLYIVSEDTIKDEQTGGCICHGKVKQSEIILPTGVEWKTEKAGVTVLDSMVLRSQIRLF